MSFRNGKIYILKSINTELVYIGSTTKSLEQRLKNHVVDFNRKVHKKSISSVKLFEKGEVIIELLENHPCTIKKELIARERYYYEQYKDYCVNICRPFISNEEKNELNIEWKNNNKDRLRNYMKEYKSTQEFKEKLSDRRKNCETITCECGGKYKNCDGKKLRHERSEKHKNYFKKYV